MSAATSSSSNADALAQLLRPATDLSAHIQGVLAEQQRLASHIDGLNAKLALATEKSPADREVLLKVDQYVAKLRASRRRVATLQQSLDATRGRLLRVHAYLKAQASVIERDNAATEQVLETELAAAEAKAESAQ